MCYGVSVGQPRRGGVGLVGGFCVGRVARRAARWAQVVGGGGDPGAERLGPLDPSVVGI